MNSQTYKQSDKTPGGRVEAFGKRLNQVMRAAQEPDKSGVAPGENHRAILAELRTGLNEDHTRLWQHVGPYLTENEHPADRWFFVVGALAGWHPMPGANKGQSLGAAMREWTQNPDNKVSESAKSYFAALLACHERDLAQHLRRIIGLLRGEKNKTPIHWQTLLYDLVVIGWSHSDRPVQERWARDFYRSINDPEAAFSTPDEAQEISSER